MIYLKIMVADATYHGKEGLTYASDTDLPIGKIVFVQLKAKKVMGFVVGKTRKPAFPVKKIISVPNLVPLPSQLIALHSWMEEFYPAALGTITQHFLPRTLPKTSSKEPVKKAESKTLPPLTIDQNRAVESLRNPGLHILHGETGTGKTRVYTELIRANLQEGKSSLILTPEIGLISQLVNDLQNALGNVLVKTFHSQLSLATRYGIWQEILQAKEPLVVVGPRSALFSPLKNIGLIVVDESHEPAYKQDKAPYYHATTVSARLAQLHNATLVLGSATPLVSDYYIAEVKARPIIYMNQLAVVGPAEKPRITVVDRRDYRAFARSKNLSDLLINAMTTTLSRNEQVLLFLNRRGTARIVLCEQCGWQAICPHCDLPLTYHGDAHSLICHTCGYKMTNPIACPECHNPTILFRSIGTKAIVDEVQKLFPEARLRRFDADNKKADRLEVNYDSVRAGEIDILIGTQTLAKGLDLPRLGLVGVINADTGLSFPDFSATERTYQLLVQVLGRIGRGHRNTQAIIQSYSPNNEIIAAVLEKDWKNFYKKELDERRKFNFPPFCYLLKLVCRRQSRNAAQLAAIKLRKYLTEQFPTVTIDGPAPSFHEKKQNQFHWQLVVKSRSRQTLLSIISILPRNWTYDIDPIDLL